MSPERMDSDLKPRRPRRVAPSPRPPHRPVDRLDLLDAEPPLAAALPAILDAEPPLVAALPAILNDSIRDAPIAVMTRIALDWIIRGTPFDRLFEETAEGQYTREFTLGHLV